MEHTKKMVLVPPEFFNRMSMSNSAFTSVPQITNNDQSHPPTLYSNVKTPLTDMEYEMNNILHDQNLDERQKWNQYYQILQRFFHHAKSLRQPVELGVKDSNNNNDNNLNTLSDNDIISTFPLSMQKQAERLLNWIKRSNAKVEWDEKGEVTMKGYTISNSNIIDLIGDLLRHRKTAIPPVGYQGFIKVLKESNIPEELIGNKERAKQMSTLNLIYQSDVENLSPGDQILPTPPKIIVTRSRSTNPLLGMETPKVGSIYRNSDSTPKLSFAERMKILNKESRANEGSNQDARSSRSGSSSSSSSSSRLSWLKWK